MSLSTHTHTHTHTHTFMLTLFVLCCTGTDCSIPVPGNVSYWTREDFRVQGLARASHKAVVHQGVMWVVGGHVFSYTNYEMVKA